MRRLLPLMLFALLGSMFPAAGFAQTGDPCIDALAAANDGATWYGDYEIVWGSGGAGSQVVLGTDGHDVLSGGSGNDILCGFGGDDVLDGGSGNDYLDAGTGINQLYGGSGNDTLIGMEGNVFDGGSGSNEVIPQVPALTACEIINAYEYVEGGATLDLPGANLRGCETNVRLVNANLAGADLTGAALSNSSWRETNLQGAILVNASIESWSFFRDNMQGADMSGVVWRHGSFLNTNGANISFVNAVLYEVDFIKGDFTGADFTGASLENVEWEETICPDGTNSLDHADTTYLYGTCEGHLFPAP